jgi:hypothetical protein
MSFSISPISSISFDTTADSSPAPKAPAVKPTANEQIQQMASAGQSAALIASALGMPVSQVDSVLGISSSSTDQASALVALSGRLSARA